jgi:5'-methylthioadenosine phosphorylase
MTVPHPTARTLSPIAIGVIGGSGLYAMPGLTEIEHVAVETPYGPPSAPLVVGTLRGKRVAFIPRHGIGHRFTPSTVPYRANIAALKMIGVRWVVAVNACGSLRDEYAPGHIVIPDQLLDFTKADRGRSFFDTGLVGHVSMADPFSPELNAIAADAVRAVGGVVHEGGTYVTIEGPRFSTRAESHFFRAAGCSIIGMTTCPEAFLAREAEMAYTTMSHVTDYDVWHTAEQPVTVDQVVATMGRNLALAQAAVAETVARIDEHAHAAAHTALDNTVMTAPDAISADMRARIGGWFRSLPGGA